MNSKKSVRFIGFLEPAIFSGLLLLAISSSNMLPIVSASAFSYTANKDVTNNDIEETIFNEASSTNSAPVVTLVQGGQEEADIVDLTANVDCGNVVSGVVELNLNLECSQDGLIVGADYTTIRLNGHSIMGPGPKSSKVGISVGNHVGVTIQGPGTIEQWQAAVFAADAKYNNVFYCT